MAKDARSTIQRVFASAGYAPHQIAGVLAHAERESGFDPNAVGDSGASRGLFQWQGPRLKALQQFAADAGGKVNDPEIQAMFAVNELQTSEKGANKALQNARDPREASIAMNRFERFSHNGGWKQTDRGESGERVKSAMRFAGDANTNVAEKSSPFDQAAQSVTDHMNKSTEGKRLQADYVNKTAPAPLEKEIAQAVDQNDQADVQQASVRVPRAETKAPKVSPPQTMHGEEHVIDERGWPKGTGKFEDASPPNDASTPRWKQRMEERKVRPETATVDDAAPAKSKPTAQPTTEDDIIRQVLREEQLGREVSDATGIDPSGKSITPDQAFNPTSVSKIAAPLAGGAVPLAIEASDQGNQRGPVPNSQGPNVDPAMTAVQDKVGGKPAAQSVDPKWLLEALGDTVLPAVQSAAKTDPTVLPAADVVAKSVVRSMAVQDAQGNKNDGGYYQRMASQAGYSGDSQEMLRAVQMDQSGQMPPASQAMSTVPLPQPKPQDMPIDVSSFISGGGFEVG